MTARSASSLRGLGRPAFLFPLWALLIIVGFALVIALGTPLPTADDELAAARAPAAPVSEDSARRSAETIIRIEYPEFVGIEPVVDRRADFGIDRFVILYTDPARAAGVRISILVESGKVDVSSYN